MNTEHATTLLNTDIWAGAHNVLTLNVTTTGTELSAIIEVGTVSMPDCTTTASIVGFSSIFTDLLLMHLGRHHLL